MFPSSEIKPWFESNRSVIYKHSAEGRYPEITDFTLQREREKLTKAEAFETGKLH